MQDLPVNVFWDLENCAVPSNMKGIHVVNAIRQFSLHRGVLKNISAFANLKLIKDELRSNLQECGVLLHDVTRNKSNASDIAILVEILKLVIDNKPPHCIVLISGDRDFSNVLNTLTFRRYQVYLIHSTHASDVLKYSATASFEWMSLLKGTIKIPNSPPLLNNNTNNNNNNSSGSAVQQSQSQQQQIQPQPQQQTQQQYIQQAHIIYQPQQQNQPYTQQYQIYQSQQQQQPPQQQQQPQYNQNFNANYSREASYSYIPTNNNNAINYPKINNQQGVINNQRIIEQQQKEIKDRELFLMQQQQQLQLQQQQQQQLLLQQQMLQQKEKEQREKEKEKEQTKESPPQQSVLVSSNSSSNASSNNTVGTNTSNISNINIRDIDGVNNELYTNEQKSGNNSPHSSNSNTISLVGGSSGDNEKQQSQNQVSSPNSNFESNMNNEVSSNIGDLVDLDVENNTTIINTTSEEDQNSYYKEDNYYNDNESTISGFCNIIAANNTDNSGILTSFEDDKSFVEFEENDFIENDTNSTISLQINTNNNNNNNNNSRITSITNTPLLYNSNQQQNQNSPNNNKITLDNDILPQSSTTSSKNKKKKIKQQSNSTNQVSSPISHSSNLTNQPQVDHVQLSHSSIQLIDNFEYLTPSNQLPLFYKGIITQFIPLIELIDKTENKKIQFSELGIKLPYSLLSSLGYSKLNSYLYDAQSLGLISIKEIRQNWWAFAVHKFESINLIDLSKFIKKIFGHLLKILDSLKKDYFIPTESQIVKRMKTLNLPNYNFDVLIMPVAKFYGFIIEGEKPNRLIYPASGRFEGVNPATPNPDYFLPHTWKILESFLKSVHPISKFGRYGFAMYLKESGPSEIKEMPLAIITSMVELSFKKKLLIYKNSNVYSNIEVIEPPQPMLLQPAVSGNGGRDNQEKLLADDHGEAESNSPIDGNNVDSLQDSENNNLSEDSLLDSSAISTLDHDGHIIGEDGHHHHEMDGVVLIGNSSRVAGGVDVVGVGGSVNSSGGVVNSGVSGIPSSVVNESQKMNSSQSKLKFDESTVPITFTWPYSGHVIQLTGSFFMWDKRVLLTHDPELNTSLQTSNVLGIEEKCSESHMVSSVILRLAPGRYEYKFVIDGNWEYDPQKPQIIDERGNVNNILIIN